MAEEAKTQEQEEEIVIIEDSDAAAQSSVEEEVEERSDTNANEDEQNRKKLLIFGGIAIVLVLVLTVLVVLLVVKSKKKEKPTTLSTASIEKRLEKKRKIEPSKLEHLIAKANYLYTSGQKEQALKLYEYIAQYSEAISQYNLGVARLKNKQYEAALQSFNNAIANGEKRCVSALDAAVCALHLGKKEEFRYYIDLAEAYLPNEVEAPLYSYYYALIKFYRQNYYESLVALTKTDNPEYIKKKSELQTKLFALFNDNYHALESIETLNGDENAFSKALLYARVGDLILAKANFETALSKGFHPKQSTLGLVYTELKLGRIDDAARELKNGNDTFGEELLGAYPINVFLRKSLFDPYRFQSHFREAFTKDEFIIFSEIFYFSPYKIFNANQTINYIRKGNAASYIDSVDSAEGFLQKSASTSKANKGIAQAIRLALRFRIREANALLQKMVEVQPKHAILHYNLALTYAQLGDMHKAYKHFLWSYHLDAKNYLPGIYAYMTSRLIHKEDTKLLSSLKEALTLEEDNERSDFLRHLLHLAQGHYMTAVDWLDNTYKTKPVYLIMGNIIALELKNHDKALKYAQKLLALLPEEILPNIIYLNTKNAALPKPDYAKEASKYLKTKQFSFKDLYHGAEITRNLTTKLYMITGKTLQLTRTLRHYLDTTTDTHTTDAELSLAYALFFNQNFEESYVLYNQLIDNEHIQDPRTLFLAALASIEASHHANAIALIELAKLKDKRFLEGRYALGLLYLEVGNPRGAQIEFANMRTNNFHSSYFNFDIDLEKLTFKKQHPNEK